MIYDKTIQSLMEKYTQDLYHYTSLKNIESILHHNKFSLVRPRVTDELEQRLNNRLNNAYRDMYYFSTSRSKFGGFPANIMDGGSRVPRNKCTRTACMIHLDGIKLGQKYRIRHVEYGDTTEQEDRVMSSTSDISPASRYIIDVHIQIPTGRVEEWMMEMFTSIQESAEKINVPIYWYYNQPQAYTQQRTSKAYRDIDKLLQVNKLV
jgi:hypothetical protein